MMRTVPCSYSILLHLLILIFTFQCDAECPRRQKHAVHRPSVSPPSIKPTTDSHSATNANAPSKAPEERFIQATFLHNDKSDDDTSFSAQFMEVFDVVRQRLDLRLRLIIDLEHIDCTKGDHQRCLEYRLRDPFHLLVIEDSSHGAEVYSLERRLNKDKRIIEASLLSALSQHNGEDLSIYASEASKKAVGFVRKLTNEEVIEAIAKPPASPKRRPTTTIVSRSPYETNLIELSLLDFRSFDQNDDWHKLDEYTDANTLESIVQSDNFSFILFWTNVNSISQHTFWLWSKSSERLKKLYPNNSIGAVSCHKYSKLCENYEIEKTDQYHTIYVHRNGKQVASIKDLKDIDYYVDRVKIIMNGEAIRLNNDQELQEARKGKLSPFDGIRPAISIGVFGSETSVNLDIFMKVCELFIGRYHFAYYIKKGVKDTLFTVRPYEKKKRYDFEGDFDMEALIHFVTKSSFPTVIDISNGLTSDIFLRQPRPVILLLHSESSAITSFLEFCAKKISILCATIERERCDAINDLIGQIKLDDQRGSTKLIIFNKDKVYASEYEDGKGFKEIEKMIDTTQSSEPIKIIGTKDVHPLRYIQLSHVNAVFGQQQITLLPDPQIVDTYFHHDDMDELMNSDDAYGGCPIMSQLNRLNQEDNTHHRIADEL